VKFSQLVKREAPDIEISKRYEDWMEKNGNPEYSAEAIRFLNAQLHATPRNRKGTVSASSLGSCRRRQVFTFLGMSQLPPSARTAAIFQNGTFMHLRWQMAGITEGWLAMAEVPVGENNMGLSGTLDGVSYKDSVVEFKSINSHGFRGVSQFGPKHEHKMQVGTYMYVTGRDKSVVIYENKDTQEYTEQVVMMDTEIETEVIASTESIWGYIHQKDLPEPMTKCEERTGVYYNNCPYRDRCLQIRDWEQAEEISNGN
jgi:hypothetical protein